MIIEYHFIKETGITKQIQQKCIKSNNLDEIYQKGNKVGQK